MGNTTTGISNAFSVLTAAQVAGYGADFAFEASLICFLIESAYFRVKTATVSNKQSSLRSAGMTLPKHTS